MSSMAEDTGPLSIDQAVGILSAEPEPAPVEAPEVEQPELEADAPADEPLEPVEATPEGEEEPEEPVEVIPRPQSWAAEHQAAWDAVPDETKAVIMAQETRRDRDTQKAVQTASEARRLAEQEVANVTQLKAVLDQTVPAMLAATQSKWSGWTPQAQVEMARNDPARYTALDAEYKADQQLMAQAQAANQQAQSVAFSAFVREQEARLPELAPELADPKTGPTERQALAAYLGSKGVPESQIRELDAVAISIAYDAMRYRQSRGHLAQTSRPTPAKPALKPAAATAVRTPQREVEAAKNRFNQTRSVDDAVAFLNRKSG